MAARKSSQLVIIGVSVFVIGAGLVYLGLNSKDPGKPAATPTPSAATSIPPGSTSVTTRTQTGGTAPVVVPIPKGMQAVAVSLDRVAGLAGYAKPGDTINLYATVKSSPADCKATSAGLDCAPAQGERVSPYARLLLSNVKVLDVAVAAASADPTFLLALSAKDAERVIFVARFESLWASLMPAGQAVPSTKGQDYRTIQ